MLYFTCSVLYLGFEYLIEKSTIKFFRRFFLFSSDRLSSVLLLLLRSDRFNLILISQLVKTSDKLLLNRLRNIFLKVVKDSNIWSEINKMFCNNILNIFSEFIYERGHFFYTSWLSIFLFEILFIEFDIRVYQFSLQFNSFKVIYFPNFNFMLNGNFDVEDFLPLKLDNSLLVFSRLIKLNLEFFIFYEFSFSSFKRQIFNFRYKDRIILTIFGQKSFSDMIFGKVVNFLKSSFHFDIIDHSFLPFYSNFLYFCGFHLSIVSTLVDENRGFTKFSVLLDKKRFLNNVFFRINSFRIKVSKSALRRVNSELLFHIIKMVKSRGIYSPLVENSKLWIYIFQCEAVRCSRSKKLILTFDFLYVIPDKQFSYLKLDFLDYYKSYSFRIYLEKIRFVLLDTVRTASWFFPKIIMSLDLSISKSLFEIVKMFGFFYIDYSFTYGGNACLNEINVYISRKDYFLRTLILSCFPKLFIGFRLKILMPVKYLVEKFRSLGFIHFLEVRPIGNIYYFSYSDFLIVRSFGYIAFSILFWFRIAQNFSSLKVFLEFLRNSCLLTLSRKHNKGRIWAFSVYTSNIIILKLFDNSSCVRAFG